MNKITILAAAFLLSACSNGSQPLAPGAATPSALASVSGDARSAPLDHKGPNYFDPPPMQGWDAAKWHNLTYTSQKYVFGRALWGLPVTEESLQTVATKLGLAYLGNGRVRFPDGTTVDAILGRNSPKPRWNYQVI
jgi:hypothetical protein